MTALAPLRGRGLFVTLCVLFELIGGSALSAAGTGERVLPSLDPAKAIHHYVHDSWTMEDGLPSDTVRDIAQTRDGYLWLATPAGLVRFDGVRFKTFNTQNSPGLPTNFLTTLCASRDGSLWIGSNGGLIRFRDGEFSALTAADGLAGDVVEGVLEDRDGVLWIVAGGEAHRLVGGSLSLFERPDGFAEGWVNSVAPGANGTFWLTTQQHGLIQWQRGQWRRFTAADGLPIDHLRFAYRDRVGALWLAELPRGESGGLVRYSDGEFVDYSDDGLLAGRVHAVHASRNGSVWIAFSGGLLRFRDERFDAFTPASPPHRFKALYEDREGSLWIGIYGGGLQRFSAGPFTTYSALDGLRGGMVMSIYEDRNQNLWVGDHGGLSRHENGRFVPMVDIPFAIRAIGEDEDGALWLGTVDALLHYANGQLTRYPTSRPVTLVYSDRQERLHVGFREIGLQRFSAGAFAAVEELRDQWVRWIDEDRLGVLWFGTHRGGLGRLEGSHFSWVTTSDGLSSDALISFHRDDEGTLWTGTEGRGLNRVKDGVITSYTFADGLHDDAIWPVLEDDRDNLWMGGDRGVFRVSKQDIADFDAGRIATIPSVVYGRADGLQSLEGVALGDPSGWRTSDGRLWFATMGGVAMVDPEQLEEEPPPPPPLVEEVLVDGVEIERRAGLKIPVGSSELEIRFTALSFIKPDQIRFQSRLDGGETWRDHGARRAAFYTDLPPGSHHLEVRAGRGDDSWSESAELRFDILPAWWQTWWLRSAAGLLAVGLLAGAHRLRVRTVTRRTRERVRQVAQRERTQLELTLAETQLLQQRDELAHVQRAIATGEISAAISHEISQPLTAIGANADAALGFLSLDEPDLDELREILRDIAADDRRAAEVLKQVRNLIKKQPTTFESLDINEIVRSSFTLLHSSAVMRQIGVDLDLAAGLPPVDANHVELEQVLLNLMKNGCEAMEGVPRDQRKMVLTTRAEDDGDVHVCVLDTGPGLDEQDPERLFKAFHTTKAEGLGMGLAISRSIIAAHGGRIWAENNPGQGARFCFTLPSGRIPEPEPEGSMPEPELEGSTRSPLPADADPRPPKNQS